MFEKEAEEEINKEHWNYSIFKDLAQEYWQKGAEYGYNKVLEEATHNYNAIIADYAKRIAELKKENTELKELIKNIIRVTWGEGWNYSLDWKVKAEQFLKEVER